jgi:hypothetical protein
MQPNKVRLASAVSKASSLTPSSVNFYAALSKVRLASAASEASGHIPSSVKPAQWRKTSLVNTNNHNFKINLLSQKSTHHKLGETNNKLNTQ